MGEDVDEDVQFLGQFWCDRAEIWMVEDVDEDVQFLGQFWCDRAEIWMVDSVWDSAPVFQISKRSDAKWA